MEHQDPLICWAIANAKDLNLVVTQLNWTESINLNAHSFSCEITINNITTKGFGKSRTQEVAIKKAIIEAIERYLTGEFKLNTSNGVAGHTVYNSAAKNAIYELIERDLLLCHFLTKTPFVRINEDIYKGKYSELLDWSRRSKIKFSLYYLGLTGCLGLIDGQMAEEAFGYFVTSTFSDSLDESIENTLLNLAGRGFYYIKHKKPVQNSSLEDFLNLQSPDFDQHGLLALNLEYANSISFLFESEAGIIGSSLKENLVACASLLSSNPILKNIPASFVRAQSEYAQNLFLGFPNENFINLNRLSEFSNVKQNMQTILHLPHPMD